MKSSTKSLYTWWVQTAKTNSKQRKKVTPLLCRTVGQEIPEIVTALQSGAASSNQRSIWPGLLGESADKLSPIRKTEPQVERTVAKLVRRASKSSWHSKEHCRPAQYETPVFKFAQDLQIFRKFIFTPTEVEAPLRA